MGRQGLNGLITFWLTIGAILFSRISHAHVKWFLPVEGEIISAFTPYGLLDTPVLIWCAVAVLMIVLSIVLDSKLPILPLLENVRQPFLMYLLKLCTGLSLLMSAYSGVIFAPHLQASAGVGDFLILVEAVIGLLFIANFHIFAATILLFFLFISVILVYGLVPALEYLNILGIACCLQLFHFYPLKFRTHLKAYSIASLRILTGIAVITLGFSEKLLNPELGEFFVSAYQWNFMANMGIESFTDQLFVFSAGVMEVVFGIILVLGTTTRINILVVSVFMLASNITFFASGEYSEALTEIFGHLPIIATAMILIFFGSGNKLKVTELWSRQTADLSKFE